MKRVAVSLLMGLLIAGNVVASNASVIYQDDFSVNNYDSRYTTDRSATWPQPSWEYVSLGSGNTGLAPGLGVGNIGFSTNDYLNGHFTNTSYTVQVSFVCPNNVAPSLDFSLLNNGWGCGSGSQERYFGYDAEFNNGGCLAMGLHRCNLDGTKTELVPTNYSWVGPLVWDARFSVLSTLTATVDVLPTETDLTFIWNGVKHSDGTPTSYSISYQDTSVGRFTGGMGIGFAGNAGQGSEGGLILDNFTVTTPVPEPSSFVAVACGVISLLGIRRRRA